MRVKVKIDNITKDILIEVCIFIDKPRYVNQYISHIMYRNLSSIPNQFEVISNSIIDSIINKLSEDTNMDNRYIFQTFKSEFDEGKKVLIDRLKDIIKS